MPKASLIWKLEGGYSRFVQGAKVGLRLESGPTELQLNSTPWGLFKGEKPVELTFRVDRKLSGKFLPGMRWKLGPEARLRALILPPGSAFLGNYRVPKEHFAVQWSVEVVMQGESSSSPRASLLKVDGNSSMKQSWVVQFDPDEILEGSLVRAWKLCPSPFEAESVWSMLEGQVVHWTWKGTVRFSFDVGWDAVQGWTIGSPERLLRATGAVSFGVEAGAKVQLSKSGHFAIRLSKRQNRVRFSLLEDRSSGSQTGFRAGVTLKERLGVRALEPLVRPLVEPLNRKIEQALAKRVEISLALDSQRWKRTRWLLQANWRSPVSEGFILEYQTLIRGGLAVPRPGFQAGSRFERIEGRRFSVVLNLLDRFHLSRTSERKQGYAVEVDPLGNLLVEESSFREKGGYRWSEVQFIKLIWHVVQGEIQEDDLLWVQVRDEKMTRKRISGVLRIALKTGAITRFSLPSAAEFPRQLRVTWATAFTRQGIEKIIRAEETDRWSALARSFSISQPEKYGRKTIWRDWIDYPKVRECLDVNPAQGHLSSRYPLPGRSREERLQVSSAYRSAKSFLKIVAAWESGSRAPLLELLGNGCKVPAFLFFHLLCPSELRESTVVLSGGLEAVFGSSELAARLGDAAVKP